MEERERESGTLALISFVRNACSSVRPLSSSPLGYPQHSNVATVAAHIIDDQRQATDSSWPGEVGGCGTHTHHMPDSMTGWPTKRFLSLRPITGSSVDQMVLVVPEVTIIENHRNRCCCWCCWPEEFECALQWPGPV